MTTELLPKTDRLIARSAYPASCPTTPSGYRAKLFAGSHPHPPHLRRDKRSPLDAPMIGRARSLPRSNGHSIPAAGRRPGGTAFRGHAACVCPISARSDRLIEPRPKTACEPSAGVWTAPRRASRTVRLRPARTTPIRSRISSFAASAHAARRAHTARHRGFIVLRGREISRHSMQHVVGDVRSFPAILPRPRTSGLAPRPDDRHAAHLSRRVAAPSAAMGNGAVIARLDRSRGQVRMARLLHPASDRALRPAAFRSRVAAPRLDRLGTRHPAREAAQDALDSHLAARRQKRSGC